MDVVIPLKDNITEFTELRFALRSIERYLANIDHVYLVTTNNPAIREHFTNLRLIEAADLFSDPRDKEINIMHKVITACEEKNLSDDFLFTNDDIFLLKDMSSDSIPFYTKNTLEEGISKRTMNDPYTRAMLNTVEVLKKRNLRALHFDVHAPIIYNKLKFQEIAQEYPWAIRKRGFLVKSLYGNSLCLDGPYHEDLKFKRPVSKVAIHRRIKGRPMFSTDEASLNHSMIEVLQELYPNHSKWEI